MSAILYNLTVTDEKGKVLHEVTHTSPMMLAEELPRISEESEKKLKQEWLAQLENQSEVL